MRNINDLADTNPLDEIDQLILRNIKNEMNRIHRNVPFSELQKVAPIREEILNYLVYLYLDETGEPVFFTTFHGNRAYPLKILMLDQDIDLGGAIWLLEILKQYS